MKVGMYYNNSDVRVVEQKIPTIGNNDILIKVMACGICGSDLMEWYRIKRAPLVLGHELAGEIVEIGKDVVQFQVGDKVFTTHHVPCNECYYCLTGHHTACQVFQTENNFEPGGFAEFLRVGGRSIKTGTFKLPKEMSYETATFIEPLATVVRALRTIDLQLGDNLMIFGCGLAGILFVKLARALGSGKIIVSDVSEYRMEIAKKSGAHLSISAKEDVPSFVRQNNNERLADKVIICTGALTAAKSALNCVDRGGNVLFFAVPKPGEKIPIDFNPYWRNDVSIKTCYGAAPLDNKQALDLLRTGVINVEDMITHRFSLNDIGEAFKRASKVDGTLKVIVEPN
ncbi:MAG: alcohol dehydrogenase catalytic domain-containing protein [bacterium]